MSAKMKNHHDELLDGLALFDAYTRHDVEAVETVLATGADAADHLHGVLMVTQMIALALERTSKHSTEDVVDAIRRQLVYEREKNR